MTSFNLYHLPSPMAQLVKNPPAIRETWVWSLGWEDPLEKGKATHSSILPWRIPGTIQCMGSQRVGHSWATFTFTAPISNYSHTGFRTSTFECWQGMSIQSVSVMSFLNSTYAISLTLVISLFQILIVSCLLDNKNLSIFHIWYLISCHEFVLYQYIIFLYFPQSDISKRQIWCVISPSWEAVKGINNVSSLE